MPFIQLPGDSTGKLLETVAPALSSAGSTMHREVMVVGDWNSSQLAPATSSGGLLVALSNPSTAATVFQGTSPWITSFTSGVLSSAGATQISGFVVSIKTTTATAAAQTAVATSGTALMAANASRHRLMVQNSGIIPVRLALSTSLPTATAYHVSLNSASAADNGTGGTYIDEMWRGGVSAITSAAGGTVVLMELTT